MLSEKWTEIEFALQVLGISDEEAKGIWAILAAICHLGCAGISVGKHTSNWYIVTTQVKALESLRYVEFVMSLGLRPITSFVTLYNENTF